MNGSSELLTDDSIVKKFFSIQCGTKMMENASHHFNSKNNGPVLLFKTLFRQ